MINALSAFIPYGAKAPAYDATQQYRANVEIRTNNAEQVQVLHAKPPEPVIGVGARDAKEESQQEQPPRKETRSPQLEALHANMMSRPVKAQRAVTRFLLTAAANASLPKEETSSNPRNRSVSAAVAGQRPSSGLDVIA
ncbi:MAG: hypothetical protein HQL60_02185 [Magnetococcales bacterium]|nr:hypothetical protein [Magnetococcales bacterium]